jgi:hypothetical protein
LTDNMVQAESTFQQAMQQREQDLAAVTQASQQATQAGQAVTDARHSEQQAAQGVTSAEQGVQAAIQGVQNAEQSLASAQQSELQAQQALTQARVDAQQQLDAYGRQLDDQSTSEDEARLRLVQAQQAVQQAGLANTTLASLGAPTSANAANFELLLQQQEAQNELNDTLAQGTQLQQEAAAAQSAGVNGNAQVVQAQQQVTQSQQQTQQAAQGLQGAQLGVVSASDAVANAQYSEQQSHIAVQNALDAAQTAQAAYKTAQDNVSISTDISSASGLQNFQTLEQLFEQNLTTTGSVKDATDATESEGAQLGITKGDVDNVINSLTKFPINTTFSIVGTPSLNINSLVQAAKAAGVDPFSLGLPIQDVNNAVIPPGVGGHATGGQIAGPGTATSDSIIARLSNREWVHPVSSVDYYGEPFMAAIQNQAIPREMLPGFASGGQVDPKQLVALNFRLAGWDTLMQATSNVLGAMGAPSLPNLPPGGYFGPAITPSVSGAVPSVPSSRAENESIVQSVFSQFGWGSGTEWDDSVKLIMRESGFNNTAQNPASTAYGIFQFLNSTWGGYGVSKTSDPATQALGGARYIQARYHDPIGAWAHETSAGWYDNGGMLPPGITTVFNGTGKPEPVFTNGDLSSALAGARSDSGSGGVFSGQLYLDSGEFLGVVQGEISNAQDDVASSLTKGLR